MNQEMLLEKLTATPFDPFIIVTNSGDRYRVGHPELAKLTPRHVYVFVPIGDKGLVKDATIIGLRNISALEPLSEAA